MEKITFYEFCEQMSKAAIEGRHLEGVIVYKESNWDEKFSLESRSYATSSEQKYFGNYCGKSLFASALDGSDPCVRLDWYHWEVDYCYILNK